MDALLTADPIAGVRAYQLGLVSRLTTSARLDATALQVAEKIASHAPMAVRLAREIADRAAELTDPESLGSAGIGRERSASLPRLAGGARGVLAQAARAMDGSLK